MAVGETAGIINVLPFCRGNAITSCAWPLVAVGLKPRPRLAPGPRYKGLPLRERPISFNLGALMADLSRGVDVLNFGVMKGRPPGGLEELLAGV